ncbi:MAG: tRNA (guanosine(37)-N1)-methyltransferase TrmD [bacterium]|nr:tRNA (guanosine(37)-N1)-methyltransferase TrmD [bacterium]
MRFNVITPFPEAFASYLGVSILKRAIERKLASVRFDNPRKFSVDRRGTIDGKPYGGGAGMVLMAGPILRAVERAQRGKGKSERVKVIVLSAKGKQFNQRMAYGWARRYDRLVLVSGRYEGIDERVRRVLRAEEVSIGPFVLTDGDVAAMAIVSAVARLIPGVIRQESLQEESHRGRLLKREARSTIRRDHGGTSSEPQSNSEQSRAASSGQAGDAEGLEYPHYTRPDVLRWKGKTYRVPKVLLSGNHRRIAAWRAGHRSRR